MFLACRNAPDRHRLGCLGRGGDLNEEGAIVMDDQRFDALVRALGRGPSRRTVLTGLVGATLGGLLSLLGEEVGDAARGRKNGKRQQKTRPQKKRAGKRRPKALSAQNMEACPVPLDLFEPCPAKVGICHRTGSATN